MRTGVVMGRSVPLRPLHWVASTQWHTSVPAQRAQHSVPRFRLSFRRLVNVIRAPSMKRRSFYARAQASDNANLR